MSNLLLSFADLNIYLEFKKESLERVLKRHIVNQIKMNYATLINNKKTNKNIHYKIIFQDSDQIKQIKLKEEHFYAEFYSKVTDSTYKTYYHISPLQFQSLLYLILYDYAKKSSLLMLHSSANLIHGKSVSFIGKSGSGKTTIMKMLSEKYTSLADDSFIVGKNKYHYISYQTPFVEKIKFIIKNNNKIPLGGIYLLKKSTNYKIQQITDKNFILKSLLQNCLIDDRNNITTYMKKVHDLTYHFNNFYFVEFGLDKTKLYALFERK